jgi:hypothetical protein
MAVEVPSLVIEELTGSQRSIELTDRALPHKTVGWPGEQRTKRTLYPGNPVATIQVLGSDEGPLELTGRWIGQYISQGMAILMGFEGEGEVDAEALVQAFIDLRTGGNLLRVTWGPRQVQGVLKRFEPSYERTDLVQWKASFELTQAGTNPAPRASAPAQTTDSTTSALSRFLAVAAQIPGYMNPPYARQVTAAVQACMSAVTTLLSRVASLANTPFVLFSEYQGVDSAASDAVLSAEAIRQLCSDPPAPAMCPDDLEAHLLGALTWAGEMGSAALNLGAQCVATREAVRVRAVSDYLAEVRLKDAQTLRDVARDYYGSPDAWTTLADANDLVGSVQPAGTLVRVPRRNQSGGRA